MQALAAIPGIRRLEAWQVMYATNDNATRTLRARDADCAAVNAAVKAGIVVCVATGNDGKTAYMPSPAAANRAPRAAAFIAAACDFPFPGRAAPP